MAEILGGGVRSSNSGSSSSNDNTDAQIAAPVSGGRGTVRGRERGRGSGRGRGGSARVTRKRVPKLKLRYDEKALFFQLLLREKTYEKVGASRQVALVAVLSAFKGDNAVVRERAKNEITIKIISDLLRNYRKSMTSVQFLKDDKGEDILDESGEPVLDDDLLSETCAQFYRSLLAYDAAVLQQTRASQMK
jgi:hypothetical protein